MIYGTGKMACPACYVRAMEEAKNKGREMEARQAEPKAAPAAAAALSVALVNNGLSLAQAPAAPVEPAACQDCTRKRGQSGPCSDYGGFGCGLYFEQHPETHFKEEPAKVQEVEAETLPAVAPALNLSALPSMKDDAGNVKPEYLPGGAAYQVKPAPVAEDIAPGSFESKDAAAALRPILDRVIKSVYLPEYRAKVTDAEALGVLVSKFFKWDGGQVLAVAFSGLEDSNFHAEARAVERMQNGEDLEAKIKELSAALAVQLAYCEKQIKYNSEEAALWTQAAEKARAALDKNKGDK
jgi:hypothetical protein